MASVSTAREGVVASSTQTHKTYWYRRETVPEMCLNEPCVMGIDEAGRGAALGAMTYGAAYWTESSHDAMCALNFDVCNSRAKTQTHSFKTCPHLDLTSFHFSGLESNDD
mmetsp:Transcript_2380/g.4246  ORF Transcript_2380/g.4246 Transcript_2380/m.4246 type:complete len:110 (+) Transcript_2380:55-384(+)